MKYKAKIETVLFVVLIMQTGCVGNKIASQSIPSNITADSVLKRQLQTNEYTKWRMNETVKMNPGLTDKGLSNGQLKYPIFVGVKLNGSDFSNTSFRFLENNLSVRPNFMAAHLTNCRFTGAKLDHMDLRAVPSCNADMLIIQSKLYRCDFSNAQIKHANLTGSEIVECKFDGADLSGAYLEDYIIAVNGEEVTPYTRIYNCSFVRSKLNRLQKFTFNDCDMSYADLRESQICLKNCILVGANVSGIDLNRLIPFDDRTRLVRALQGVVYDKKTIWPNGVTPEQCNAVLREDKGTTVQRP